MTRHSPEVTEVSPARAQERVEAKKKSGKIGYLIAGALVLAALPFVWGIFSSFTAGVQ